MHLLALGFLLSPGSVTAWSAGVRGDTPINSALTVQMDLYPYWRDTLLPQFGFWSYPMTMGLMVFEMLIISVVYVPAIFLVFRYLGGKGTWRFAARIPGFCLWTDPGCLWWILALAGAGHLRLYDHPPTLPWAIDYAEEPDIFRLSPHHCCSDLCHCSILARRAAVNIPNNFIYADMR